MALTRRALGGLTIGGSAAVTLAACGGNEGGSDSNAEVVWAIDYAWEAWNENTSTGNNSSGARAMRPMNPAGQIGYDFDTEGNVFYDDAIFEGTPELVSESPMVVKFALNENAQWSDGEPVRLEDFLFYWYGVSGKPEHANQEKAIPAYTGWGENIASITQEEDGSIVFTYVDGYIDPEWQFIGGVYLPSHVAEAEGFDWQNDPEAMGDAVVWFNENLWDVVVGPYKPIDWKLGEYIKYEINDKYQGSVKPTIEKLTMTVVDGTAAVVTELRQGTIAGSQPGDFVLEEYQKLDDAENLKYETYSGATWSHFDVNVKGKFLQDLALRRAVFTAINIEDITGRIFPGTEVTRKGNHFFSEGSPNYVDYAGEAGYGMGDIETARQILTDAGYTWDGNDALLSPDGEAVTFNFRFATSSESRKLTGDILQAQIEGLGVALELKGFGDDEFAAVLSSGEFDIIVFSWVGDPAFTSGPQQFFKSDSESNYGQFEDPEVDAAIELVRSTYDLDEAAGFANEVSRMAVERAWTLPLYDGPLAVVYNSDLLSNIGPNRYSQVSSEWNLREWKQP
ncbi:ABC transporter substrate-binding protein [Glycomyces sp. TRM65418]|uniref:ABC transporter substrate-binding protein n=1 Tax=Glycomyces sp. TRM65418 TaxID=2867006 RepID=UPI001CE503DE|nr:ABC transporter substrate-binding protein [Glycomyces sp. TRM65418]MCC3763701.1 ABC transporter substrate-binding protein [Glycomyces sp. TRM65418]QZD57680.1 hypothetical protein K3N28_11475 [Glycomyces sp. TRM65418]